MPTTPTIAEQYQKSHAHLLVAVAALKAAEREMPDGAPYLFTRRLSIASGHTLNVLSNVMTRLGLPLQKADEKAFFETTGGKRKYSKRKTKEEISGTES